MWLVLMIRWCILVCFWGRKILRKFWNFYRKISDPSLFCSVSSSLFSFFPTTRVSICGLSSDLLSISLILSMNFSVYQLYSSVVFLYSNFFSTFCCASFEASSTRVVAPESWRGAREHPPAPGCGWGKFFWRWKIGNRQIKKCITIPLLDFAPW